jgi:hypothetical protein
MIIEDFIMLGKTVPEEQRSDRRVFVCSAGYSRELRQFIRIYPLARTDTPSRWHSCRVPLERNPKDSRPESWKIKGDRSADQHCNINKTFEIQHKLKNNDQKDVFSSMERICNSIQEANERRLSLFVLRPKCIASLEFAENRNSPDHPQMWLFDAQASDEPQGAKRFAFQPYLRFNDEGGSHRLQLRDWGCYEFMRKFGDDRRHELRQTLRLDACPPLLLGNMNGHRNTWLVISVFPSMSEMQAPLFESSNVPLITNTHSIHQAA